MSTAKFWPKRLILIDEGKFNQIFYQYDAAGNKLCKQVTTSGAIVKTTNYFSTFETENGSLKRVITAEGEAVPTKKGFEYHYYLKDHLGSTRVVLSQAGETLQQNSYYPFGMLMEGLNTVPDYDPYQNKYLYNGKELQTDFGLDWYDYGARFYDVALGRWHVVDPLAEEYIDSSPYSYVFNNPILNIDPDGMSGNTISKTVVDPDGRIIYHDNSKDKNIYQSNYFASDGNTEGMEDIGDEEPWVDYSVGKYLMKDMYGNYSNLTSNWYPQSGACYIDLTIESFFIPLAPLFKYLKIGKYIYKLVPTKSGKFVLKFIGLADDAAKGGAQTFKSVGAAGKEVFNPKNFKGVSESFLKNNGISDIHAFKAVWLGTSKNLKLFDVVKHTGTNELLIIRKSTQEVIERTYIIIK